MQLVNVLVIDGQGGGLGKQLVAGISTRCPEARLTAVGTNKKSGCCKTSPSRLAACHLS